MRKDFNRVLTTDPRNGHDLKFSEVRRAKENATFDGEFSGGKESMKTQRRNTFQRRKSFGDHIEPLRRFMRKQVGKKWADVYSEICELFDKRSQVLYHVHQHVLDDFIELNTKMVDGKVHEYTRWDGYREIETTANNDHPTIYVHPETGIICSNYVENEAGFKAKKNEADKAARRRVFREHSKDVQLHYIDGVWWEFTMKDIPPLVLRIVCPFTTWAEERAWSKLSSAEKELTGKRVWERPAYSAVQDPYRWSSRLTRGRYYVSKKVASRRVLKQHDLVGTNKDIAVKTMNHRKAATYR